MKEQKRNYLYLSHLQNDTLLNIVKQQKPGVLSAGITGKVHGNNIYVFYRPGYRNSWNPVFQGMTSEHPNGTLITGAFHLPAIVKIFMWLWRGGVVLFLFLMLLIYFFSPEPMSAFLFIAPILMFGFSFLLEHIGVILGKKSESHVLNFLTSELVAAPFSDE